MPRIPETFQWARLGNLHHLEFRNHERRLLYVVLFGDCVRPGSHFDLDPVCVVELILLVDGVVGLVDFDLLRYGSEIVPLLLCCEVIDWIDANHWFDGDSWLVMEVVRVEVRTAMMRQMI